MTNDATAAPPRATPKRASTKAATTGPSAPLRDITDAERHFLAGRDLAVELLQEGRQRGDSGDDLNYSLRRWERAGEPLVPYAQAFLRQLLAQPETLHGFAAVLGDYLAGPFPKEADLCYGDAVYAETLPGVPGDDGTDPHPSWTPMEGEHFRATRTPLVHAVEVEAPSLPRTQCTDEPSVVALRIRDRATEVFREVRAAMMVLADYVANGADQPVMAAPGVLGTLHFAEASMCGLYDAINAHVGPSSPLWTHVHQASSLLTVLEQQEFNNFDGGPFSEETYCGVFNAVQHCIERGQKALSTMEAA